MNQQLLKGVNSIESLQETGGYSHTQVAKSRHSSLVVSKKYRVLFLIAGVLVTLAVCAAVLTAVGVSQLLSAESEKNDKRMTGDPLIELATNEQQLKQAAEYRAKRQSSRDHKITTCYSTLSNESYPAAHISGTGSEWEPLDPHNNLANGDWDTEWVCANDSDAYVDGGMIFNMTDKKLYVPVCGYYHITSQMYFYVTETDVSPEDRLKYVSLEVYVNKNCNSGDNFVLLRSYASLVLTPSI